jgi:carbon starvation protein
MGFLMRFAKLPGKWAIIIFLPLVGVAIWIGRYIPVNLPAFMPPPPTSRRPRRSGLFSS